MSKKNKVHSRVVSDRLHFGYDFVNHKTVALKRNIYGYVLIT